MKVKHGLRATAKTILVTGGAGFLGSHLTGRLLSAGHRVYCMDNLYTGRRENLAPYVQSGRLTFVEHDIVHPLPALPKFDEIYNLACPASPVHYQDDPIGTLRVCSEGVWQVLQRAGRDRADLFHASTSEVYGDPEIHPQPESYHGNVNILGPRSCYDEGKRFAETMTTDYCRSEGLRLRIARIFNTYGPRMLPNDGRVVSNFIVQALRGQRITLYGDGQQTRCFCYVDDLIDGCIRLMAADDEIAGPINLGNPIEVTIGGLAHLIIEMTRSTSKIEYKPLPADDPRRRRPDVSRAVAALGWHANIDLMTGLELTIEYFRQEIAADRLAVSYRRAGGAQNDGYIAAPD